MRERNSRDGGSMEAILLGLLMGIGGVGLIWWAWNAPVPQTEPGAGEEAVTVDVLRLADEFRSSSISNNKNHRIAYAYGVGDRRYCADGTTVSPAADAAAVCAERLREIERGTYKVLDAAADDAWRIRVIYASDAPWRGFPVEVRESPWRVSMIGLGIALSGTLLAFIGRERLKASD